MQLNDPIFVEAARTLAARVLEVRGDDRARIAWAWNRVLHRAPRAFEIEVAEKLLLAHRAHYQTRPEEAKALGSVGASAPAADLDPEELAAWTSVTRTLLNLHETITRS